jgi:hypothetical protein
MVKAVSEFETHLARERDTAPSPDTSGSRITEPVTNVPSYFREARFPVTEQDGTVSLLSVGEWLSRFPPTRGGT